jgi:hypothetical protein
MSSITALPEQFSFLEPFATVWGDLHTQHERYLKRQELSYGELAAFHGVLAPRLEEVFSHLDRFDPAALPEAEARLFRTVLGLTEASQAVEVFGQSRVPYAPYPHDVKMEWVGYQPH